MTRTILFLGDSITLGLGATGLAFPELVMRAAEEKGTAVRVQVEAVSGATAQLHCSNIDLYRHHCPAVTVCYLGTIEAIPRPLRSGVIDLMRLLPRRYQQPGWLQPRPYLPARWWKRNLYARPESYVRTRVNRLIMGVQGSATPVSADDYETSLHDLLQPLRDLGSRVVICGVGPVDGGLFPGADVTFPLYRERARRAAKALKADYVDVNEVLCSAEARGTDLLLLDRLHPNARGHAVIAASIIRVLKPELETK